MAYLGIALYAEGPSDYRFLSPLLTRLVADVFFESPAGTLDLGPVFELTEADEFRGEPRATRIAEAARAAAGGFHILFVHADGDGDHEQVRRDQVDRGLQRFLAEFQSGYAGVGVVPVREMEAWAIADGDALRAAFGTTLSDKELGIPRRARDVERELDPKRILDQAYARVLGETPRGRGKSSAAFLDLIGQSVSLKRLSELQAFQRLRTDTARALQTLHIVR